MQEKEQPKISLATLVFIIIQIIFLVFLAISIPNLLKGNTTLKREEQPKVTINNLRTLVPNLSDEYTNDIQHSLTEIVELNTTNLDIANLDATIRDNSLSSITFDYYGSKAINFIVDIPNLHQSYQMFYAYPIDVNLDAPYTNNYRTILCLEDEKQIIYPDFKCHSSFSPETRQEIVSEYLKDFEFDYFTVSLDRDNTTVMISPISESLTETAKSSYIQKTKDAIESLGAPSNLFTYKVLTQADMTYRLD